MKSIVKADDAQEELVTRFQEGLEEDDDWQQEVIEEAIAQEVNDYEERLEDSDFFLAEWSAGRGDWSLNEDGDLEQEEEGA